MTKDRKTIEEVVGQGLCTGCGTCVGICPTSAVKIRLDKRKGTYVPELIENECNQCGICLDACPGYSIDFGKLNLEVFGKEPEDILLGHYIGCYLAHAIDSEIRYNSASGGLVTSLLLFALEQGLIDGALVTRMKKDSPLEPGPFIARTREDILEAVGSKYCPVPANIALREVLEREGQYAVVGLPCHIYGIRKAEAVNKTLRQRVSLHLGIFCSHTDTFKGTEFVLQRVGVTKEEVTRISYRGGGWPGGITISLKNGTEKKVNLFTRLWASYHDSLFFSPSRCLLCGDVTNELADISFGDAWLPEIVRVEHEGKSIVISRSERGEALLRAASSKGAIQLEPLDARDVVRSQRLFLHFKKININSRKKSVKASEKQADMSSSMGVGFYNRLIAIIVLINSRLASSRLGRFVLTNIPLKVLRMYVGYFYMLYYRVINRDFAENR